MSAMPRRCCKPRTGHFGATKMNCLHGKKNMPNFFKKTMAYFEGNGWYHSKKRRFVAMGKSHQVLLAGWFFFSGVSGAPSLRIIGSIIG